MENEHASSTNDYTEIIQRLPVSKRLAYGIGHVLNDICASMWFTYLLVYLHLVLEFDATLAGQILFIGQVADALATPLVGYYSDKNRQSWLCKYGKRKTWHLIGTVCTLITIPFIFLPSFGRESAHNSVQLIYYVAFIILFQFGWAAVQISHLSMIPELTPTEHERTELIVIRYIFTVFSNIFVCCIAWAVLHITNNKDSSSQIGPDDANKFQEVLLIGLGVGSITSFLFHVFVKEGAVDNINGLLHGNARPMSVLLKDLRLYQVACVYMSARAFINLSQIYVPLYLHKSLNMPATSLAVIPLIIFLSSFVIPLIKAKLRPKICKKCSFRIGVLLSICACIWIQFGRDITYTSSQIYCIAMILGSGGSIMIVTSLRITIDFIGQNINNAAFISGIMSFTDKLYSGVTIIFIQYLESKGSYQNFYRDILVYICASSAIFGLLMTNQFFRNTVSPENEHEDLLSEEHVSRA
ncbi:major facilitator superfamily domain-containing protein 12 isoform X1 [Ptiloglossa arizonensis]|uniref:major facilitator superfamily domain-containing protein 12 isoform X1 n=1 Tax=Ptiloglossa arizonensis TaxID=3350558 RepID=UPI003FA1743C